MAGDELADIPSGYSSATVGALEVVILAVFVAALVGHLCLEVLAAPAALRRRAHIVLNLWVPGRRS